MLYCRRLNGSRRVGMRILEGPVRRPLRNEGSETIYGMVLRTYVQNGTATGPPGDDGGDCRSHHL